MRSVFKIYILTAILALTCLNSAFANSKTDKLAEEYGEKFIESMRTNDTIIFKQLIPTVDDLNQYINSLPQIQQEMYREKYPDLSESRLTIEEVLFNEFNNSKPYIINEYPMLPIDNIKFKSVTIDTSEKALKYTHFVTHKIDITFSLNNDKSNEILFEFPTYALLSENGFLAVDYYIEYEIHEIATKKVKKYAKKILSTFIENDFEYYRKKLRPDLDDIMWNIKNRVNAQERNEILQNPEDWGIDEKTFNTEYLKYFDNAFKGCVTDMNDYISIDTIKEFKYLDCSISSELVANHEVTSIVYITFSIEYLNNETIYYKMATAVLQGKDAYLFGAMDEIDVMEIDNPNEKQTQEELGLSIPEPVVERNENKVYLGSYTKNSQSGCPKSKFYKDQTNVNFRMHEYAKVIESSDKLIDCPIGITYKEIILACRFRGDSFMRIYSDPGTSYFNSKKERYKSDPLLLVDAVNSYNKAFEFIESGEISLFETLFSDLCTNHHNALAEAYNYASSIPDSQFAETRPYYEAIADGAGYATQNVEQMMMIKALSGYYAGFSLVNENNNTIAEKYLSMAVPLDSSLLSMNQETLISNLILDENTSQTVYDYLGVACYRLSVESLDLNEIYENPKYLQEALWLNKKAEKCFKLKLILAPSNQDSLNKLKKNADLHTEIQNAYKQYSE